MNTSAFRYNDHIVIRVSAPAPAPASEIDTPLHIGLLIDTSGSMYGDRINAVKRTLDAARPLFRETDTISLVTFNDDGNTLLARHRMDNEGLDQFYTMVNNLVPGGSTNLSAGLERLIEIGSDYTTLILLTDGQINAGLTSIAGLKVMALGACRNAINTLGYGSDHSRTLLSQIAIASRGSYTYADSDEVLPVIVGDILTGVRSEVFRQVEVSVYGPEAVCLEAGSSGDNTYNIGNIVADRNYWAVFRAPLDAATVSVVAGGGGDRPVVETPVTDSDAPEIQEQILRCRVTRAIGAVSDIIDSAGAEIVATRIENIRNNLLSLQHDIDMLPTIVRHRPLVLRMNGQLAEALDILLTSESRRPHIREAAHLAARMSSGVACLATQRGFYAAGSPVTGDPVNACIFSSPVQRNGSRAVHTIYSQDPAAAPIVARSTDSPGVSPP
jgi:hypothetical protein